MRKIIVLSMLTLDGVIQGPGGKKEDKSNGFKFSGWVVPYGDEASDEAVQKELKQQASYILGRKTFEIWENYWPKHTDIWPAITEGTKYVMSRKRKKSDWQHSVFIKTIADIKKIKRSKGPEIHVWGSSEIVHLLLKNDLVDELRLKIYPLVLGKGKRLFDNSSIPSSFALMDSSVTSKGVIIANYKRAGKVKTGNMDS